MMHAVGMICAALLIGGCDVPDRRGGPEMRGVVLQSGPNDCGAAALAMIAQDHRMHVDSKHVSRVLAWTPRGVTMLSLRAAAESLGLHAGGKRTTISGLRGVGMPAILFVRGNHFVVLDSISAGDSVFLRDPAIGRIVLNRRGLERIWKGEILEVEDHHPRTGHSLSDQRGD